MTAPSSWTGHVIVCRVQGVGLRIVEQLHVAGVRVVVVDDDPDPRSQAQIQEWGIPLIGTSARLPQTLHAAGVGGAAALICVEADDLHTLETALLARELRPQLRIVAQLRNPAVGRAIARTGVSVLDVAGLSAPALIQACLRTDIQDLELGPQRFLLARFRAERAGSLRELFDDLAPIAVEPADGGPTAVCPGRDHPVGVGDQVTLVGTPRELDRHELLTRHRERAMMRQARPRHRLGVRPLLGGLVRAADRRLGWAVGALLGLTLLSIVVLRIGYRTRDGSHMSWLDAVYFTVETVATIGYGDFSFRDQSAWLRVFAVMLMVTGVVAATVCFAMLTNLLVSRRIEEALGHRLVTRLSGHVVVVGLGAIGVELVNRLRALEHQVVVVESDDDNRFLPQIRGAGVPVIQGDATLPQTLQVVNLSEARAVVVTTSDDLVNLEAGLAVLDQLGDRRDHVPVVLRTVDRGLAAAVERGLPFAAVRSTSALAAPWFVGAALGLEVLSTCYVGDQPLLVGRLVVRRGGGLAGLAMQDLSARLRVVALQRHGDERLEHPPRRDTRFAEGDVAYLIGPYEELIQVLQRDRPTVEQGNATADTEQDRSGSAYRH